MWVSLVFLTRKTVEQMSPGNARGSCVSRDNPGLSFLPPDIDVGVCVCVCKDGNTIHNVESGTLGSILSPRASVSCHSLLSSL